MTICKIVAPLTGGDRDRVVLASAFAAAMPFGAHVVALFVRPDPAEAMPFFGEGVSPVVAQEIVDVAREAADRATDTAQATLHEMAAGNGVAVQESPRHVDVVSASFREVEGNFADCVSGQARLSDLVVFGPLGENDRPGLTEAFEKTLVETGRPVLLSAVAPSQDFGGKIAFAWDGSVPCAHAATAALPYLGRAAQVEVLSVKRNADDASSLADIHEYFALHGIPVTNRLIEAGGRLIGEALLETAVSGGAGLIVLGGYGHSRLRQFFGGGVTRHVVSHATIPLFLVH
jgi:nucleotide-binding universal stress UspA family protein